VQVLRNKVAELVGHPPSEIMLMTGPLAMEDGATFAQYQITEGSTIQWLMKVSFP
jgi:hypothetical protein